MEIKQFYKNGAKIKQYYKATNKAVYLPDDVCGIENLYCQTKGCHGVLPSGYFNFSDEKYYKNKNVYTIKPNGNYRCPVCHRLISKQAVRIEEREE